MTARPWHVEHARAWCERELGDVPIPLADEADFRRALRNWDYASFKIDHAVAEVYAAAEAIPPDAQTPAIDIDALEAKAREVNEDWIATRTDADGQAVARHAVDPPSPAQWLALSAEVRRLRAMVTPSPAGTVRLLYPDGSHRDVDPTKPMPMMLLNGRGDTVTRVALRSSEWAQFRADQIDIDVPRDWDAPDGASCSTWVAVRVETFEEQAARERAARLEAERQRDEVLAALCHQITFWEDVPAGVDYEASPDDMSPKDATAHVAGLAIRAAREALAGGRSQ